MSVTSEVRENIPFILKKSGKPMSEKELLNQLALKIPALVKENGELRQGVLRGVLNKLDSVPVENLQVYRSKETNKVLYAYIENKTEDIRNRIMDFCLELRKHNLLTVDFLKDSKGTIQFIQDVTKAVKELESIRIRTYR